MAGDPEQQDREQAAAQAAVQAEAQAAAQAAVRAAEQDAELLRQQAEEPEQQQEFLRQNNAIYAALIGIALVMMQPFLTATSLDLSAKICVLAFSVAIPMLAGLVLLNQQETFRRRQADLWSVRGAQAIAQGCAFAGVVAGFWHVMWLAGVGILVSGTVAMGVHSVGYMRLMRAGKTTPTEQAPEPQAPGDADA